MHNLISDEYRALNRKAHEEATGYGTGGYKHLDAVLRLAEQYGAETVLDYGCGQATLYKHARRVSPLKFSNYDPALEQYSAEPAPADMVVCTDVLEHIEPLMLPNVLAHIAGLTQKVAFLEIACRPAKRVLADGRNAHLLVRDGYFWFDTLREHMDVVRFIGKPGNSATLVCVPGGTAWN